MIENVWSSARLYPVQERAVPDGDDGDICKLEARKRNG